MAGVLVQYVLVYDDGLSVEHEPVKNWYGVENGNSLLAVQVVCMRLSNGFGNVRRRPTTVEFVPVTVGAFEAMTAVVLVAFGG